MDENRRTVKQLRLSVLLLVSVIVVGTAGYTIIEGWSLFDSLYMTIISISTTGFKEVNTLSPAGRIFTIIIIAGGVISFAFIAGRIAQLIFRFYTTQRRRMKKRISSLKNHYIICGYGRIGQIITEDLMEAKVDFVVIEKDEEITDDLVDLQIPHILGDATSDKSLEEAGIRKAKSLVTVLPTDAENVFTTLSARGLNSEIFIVARAAAEETEEKLRRAGANRVVKPLEIAANRMTHLLLRPGVMDFIDLVVRRTSLDLRMDEIPINPRSPMIGRKISEFINRSNLNMLVIGIYRQTGDFIYNPRAEDRIMEGDRLLIMGRPEDFQPLRELCRVKPGKMEKLEQNRQS